MLGWLNVSPRYFINKVNKLNDPKDKSDALELGSTIHTALLEPEKFVVAEVEKPTGKLLALCDAIIEGQTLEEAIQTAEYKYTTEKVQEIYESKGLEYVEEMLKNKDRLFLDRSTKYVVDRSVDAIFKSKIASQLLLEDNAENELEIYWEKDGIKKKGKVDKLILSNLYDNVVLNVDIKTTSSNIYELPTKKGDSLVLEDDYEISKNSYMYSFVKYGYHRQLAMYDEGIKEYIKEKYNKEVEVQHYHVVVNTTTFECMVYKFEEYWVNLGRKELTKLLEEYKWHKDTNYWDTPKDFIEGIIKV